MTYADTLDALRECLTWCAFIILFILAYRVIWSH